MKFRLIIFMLAFVTAISGCTIEEKEESKITLVNVIELIQAEGLKVIPEGQREDDALDNVTPSVFRISNPTENALQPETIYVYIFDSEKAQKEAIPKISGKYTSTLLTAITHYEQKNALVVHFATMGKIEKFGTQIQKAIQKL